MYNKTESSKSKKDHPCVEMGIDEILTIPIPFSILLYDSILYQFSYWVFIWEKIRINTKINILCLNCICKNCIVFAALVNSIVTQVVQRGVCGDVICSDMKW